MTTYRVIQISEQLRDRIRSVRTTRQQTNETLLTAAVTDHLGEITQHLQTLGFGTPEVSTAKSRPARLPIDPATIDQLREASEQLGIPATDLLRLCLRAITKNATPTKARKATKKATEKATGPEQPQPTKNQTEGKKTGKRGTGKKGGTK